MKILVKLPACDAPGDLPAWLSIPDSAVVKNGNPLFVPDFDSSFSATPFMALRISRLGKGVAPKFASRYFEDAAVALIVSADNLLEKLRANGLPWTAAVAFDRSCVLSEFFPYTCESPMDVKISCGDESQLFHLPDAEETALTLSRASFANTIKMGDLILIPLISEPEDNAVCNSELKKFKLIPDTLITAETDGKRILRLPIK